MLQLQCLHKSTKGGRTLFLSARITTIPADASKSPAMEWERWFDLFALAVMAKYSTSIEELTRTVNAENPRIRALLGDMAEEAAEKIVVTWLFLSLGELRGKCSMLKTRRCRSGHYEPKVCYISYFLKQNDGQTQISVQKTAGKRIPSAVLARVQWPGIQM